MTKAVPPVAKQIPHTHETHGHKRQDPWYWLRERENPAVKEYLDQENNYYDAMTKPASGLRDKLFQEMKARVKQDDTSVPVYRHGFYYYTRVEEGKEYPLLCRKKALDGDEQVYLDEKKEAEAYEFFDTAVSGVCPGGTTLAWTADTEGRRFYSLNFRHVDTGEEVCPPIKDMAGDIAWAMDQKTIFYVQQHPDTLRAHQLWRYNTQTQQRELVYEEPDETFHLSVYRSKSERYIILTITSTLTNEYRYLDAQNPEGEFKLFAERDRGHEYFVYDGDNQFFILSNRDAKNFKIMTSPIEDTQESSWQEWFPHRKDHLIVDIDVFRNHLVMEETDNGLNYFRVFNLKDKSSYVVDFGEAAWTVATLDNLTFDTNWLRYNYESMVTPDSVMEINLDTQEKKILKEAEVQGGYDKDAYEMERFFIEARDGVRVPTTLVYKKDLFHKGENNLLLYAYGAYGSNSDPWFSSNRLSLMDRGFVFAIAHVRGGSEMGRPWYEEGRLFHKMNTFNDFIDVGKGLVEGGYCHRERLYGTGGSAGGLLIGAVANMEPTLFRGLIAEVPFVDVVTTMLDTSIPLTTFEYDEWGNPEDKAYYDYILAYSPFDNVVEGPYPNLLVLTGFHDSQVQYWEPAKWVSKLRAVKKGDQLVLFKTNFDAGHGGASGRFQSLKELSDVYGFVLMLAGIDK